MALPLLDGGDVQPHPGGRRPQGVHHRGSGWHGRACHPVLFGRDPRLPDLRATLGSGQRPSRRAQTLHRHRLPRLGAALRQLRSDRRRHLAAGSALPPGWHVGDGLVDSHGLGTRSSRGTRARPHHGVDGRGADSRCLARSTDGRLCHTCLGRPRATTPGGPAVRPAGDWQPVPADPAHTDITSPPRRRVHGAARSATARATHALPLRRPFHVGFFVVVFPLYVDSLGATDPAVRGRYLAQFLLPFAFLQYFSGR